jgi:hypothetical protein
MLRTNLSTRPFYNVRAVQTAAGLLGIVVLALTLFNVVELIRLGAAQQSLGANARQAEDQSAQLRQQAGQLRAQVNPKELAIVAGAAREANQIIDQRVFSWTDLFAQFEATLPENVRITAVAPRAADKQLIIGVAVEARRVEDLDAFIEALEMTGTFREVLPVESRPNDEGLIEAIVEGIYIPRPLGTGEPDAGGDPPAESPGGGA